MQIRQNCHRNIWLLSGTGDGPPLARAFIAKGYQVSVSVVSYQASLAYKCLPLKDLFIGPLNGVEGIISVLNAAKNKHHGFAYVVDATHPFAVQITNNLNIACSKVGQKIIRYERPLEKAKHANVIKDLKEFSQINLQGQKILLAIGSRFLPEAIVHFKESGADIFARVLPTVDSFVKAFASQIPSKNIAVVRPLYGKYKGSIESALCRKWKITGIVCRQSGGLNQKIWQTISSQENINLWLLSRPNQPIGLKSIYTIEGLISYVDMNSS